MVSSAASLFKHNPIVIHAGHIQKVSLYILILTIGYKGKLEYKSIIQQVTTLHSKIYSSHIYRVNSICTPPLDLKNSTPQFTNPSNCDHSGSFNLFLVSNISS